MHTEFVGGGGDSEPIDSNTLGMLQSIIAWDDIMLASPASVVQVCVDESSHEGGAWFVVVP